ncbi:MAG: 1-acyl-sn-glycerol-3-phosphate acyltransferase [Planctomycetaceae bacterium]|nr:1-acyl-sn-glycerol-3-phosphate acyltransferase [Planctomycetaceae bacterium]
MQKLVFDEPYEFVPPYRGKFWSWIVGKYLPRLVRSRFGIVRWTTHGLDYLRESLNASHGIVLCPNHCRPSDPVMIGALTTGTPCHAYAMASWHVFKQSWLETFVCRRIGGFSVYREGLDRQALNLAIEIVQTAERPLVIFPEGVISAANDRLMPLMDGTAFIARSAAKKRLKENPDAKTVIHPVAFRYTHEGDADEKLGPVLDQLEDRLFWQKQTPLPLLERIRRVRLAAQSAREIQFLGHNLTGTAEERIGQLVQRILATHEQEWLSGPRTGDVISRVKDLRIAILTDMVKNSVTDQERKRRWRHLTDVYYAQCFSLHPPGYLDESLPADRLKLHMFETVERLEEELTDSVTNHMDLAVEVHVDAPIDVDPSVRKAKGGADPLMTELRQRMLKLLQTEEHWPPEPVKDLEPSHTKE